MTGWRAWKAGFRPLNWRPFAANLEVLEAKFVKGQGA